MAHLLQALAQHWHLSASQYWQMRLLCAITLAPLVGVLLLVIFTKREQPEPGMPQPKRRVRTITLRPATRLPMQPSQS